MKAPRELCRDHRRHHTDAEALLWRRLRRRQLQGCKFRREHAVGPYVLDFFCAERGLAIELDGGQHFEDAALAYDRVRSEFLQRQGIRVLRFNNDVVFRELTEVLEEIGRALGVEG